MSNEYTIVLDRCEYLGDELENINFNFLTLDARIANLENFARSLNGVYTYVNESSAGNNSLFETVTAHFEEWEDAYSIVQTNSAFWVQPITLIFPRPFAETPNLEERLTAFLTQGFSPENYAVGSYAIIQWLQWNQEVDSDTDQPSNQLAISQTIKAVPGEIFVVEIDPDDGSKKWVFRKIESIEYGEPPNFRFTPFDSKDNLNSIETAVVSVDAFLR